jgi:hypothetical protein
MIRVAARSTGCTRGDLFAALARLAAATAVAACGAPPPSVPEAAAVVVPAPRVATEPREASAASRAEDGALRDVASIELPSEIACTWRDAHYRGPLRLDPQAEPFADVPARAHSDVHLAVTLDAGEAVATVEAREGPLTIRGIARGSTLNATPVRSIRFGDLVWLRDSTALALEPEARGRVRASLVKAPRGVAELAAPLTSTLDCSDVTLRAVRFDVWASIGRCMGEARLRDADTPIARERGGPPVARLVPETPDADVCVLQRSGTEARIAWPVDGVIVVGWIAGRALGAVPPTPGGGGGGMSASGLTGLGASDTSVRRHACAASLPVAVVQRGRVVRVGTWAAGVPIATAPDVDGLSELAAGQIFASARSEVRFVVFASDLARCRQRP